MKSPDEIKKGLEHCTDNNECMGCVYIDDCSGDFSNDPLIKDALAYIQQLEAREWELFDLLSSAWFGKGCYFQQDNGTVYSRVSGKYISFDQAVDEFANAITVAGDMDKRMEDDLK